MQNVLKKIKLNESTISMALGAVVIIVIGMIVVNYFRNLETPGNNPSLNSGTNTSHNELPTTHKVVDGDTLWSISEKHYGSGYNWVDIQKENNLTDSDAIATGQELKIPDVPVKTPMGMASAAPTVTVAPTATIAPTTTPASTPSATPSLNGDGISADTYTVVHGDNLWEIAVRAYGDGYKWSEIAKANNLLNANVIHAGNVLTLPR
jgi:nucleoid-associated protein YgaU